MGSSLPSANLTTVVSFDLPSVLATISTYLCSTETGRTAEQKERELCCRTHGVACLSCATVMARETLLILLTMSLQRGTLLTLVTHQASSVGLFPFCLGHCAAQPHKDLLK